MKPTRIYLVEWADTQIQEGDLERVSGLLWTYHEWLKDQIGATFWPDGPILHKATQVEPDPGSLTPAIDQELGLWGHDDACVLFIPIGSKDSLWAGGYPGHGVCIHGDAPLMALRGEACPRDWPFWVQNRWPAVAYGGMLHEMIHSWGVIEHDGGIMQDHWLFPDTFVTDRDKDILLHAGYMS